MRSRPTAVTGERAMRSRERAQRWATKCCWRPDLSQRPQTSEMQPKKVVEIATRGARMT
jgi:hypothetical protein